MSDRHPIAEKARRVWSNGPVGKILVIALVLSACIAVVGTLLALTHRTSSEFDDCTMSRDEVKARVGAMLQALKSEHGDGKPFPGDDDRLVFSQAQFEIKFRNRIDPCDGHFEVRVPISGSTPPSLPPDRMLQALEDRNIGGFYEQGVEGTFVYDEDVKTYYLSYTIPLKELRNGDVNSAIVERLSLGDAWRKGWFDQVSRIATGTEPKPKEQIYRPGKQPASKHF